MEPDLESVPGQIGTAMLRCTDGSLVRACTGRLTPDRANIVYRMLAETGALLKEDEGLRTLSVSFSAVRYTASLDDDYVYIVQTRMEQ
mmetsp:Transcript_32841/g.50227  ORF Transcript_32841/g.50227 Transcript_32841/m.50227 type:complete len:88 (+) Transcript_32841:70-333(+)|eukprot:CAMPEP_0118707950 /NCGR_PEP_ID=MMETSP0800-20121206/21550_1 /TAXON_ID=210618 ORGANISM="Striatella unipunctata, Strain CCMP2910" /NCGR_SAMPLE_ID=MMETSP0800 /ASSEMBLY_ACC=CAM_ASM_000638 /LENGTH=87 /DNA_ID=CAMNT_0006610957 /DNA_START=48 /DNA_END=311 /DNA_ORIENTATION=+